MPTEVVKRVSLKDMFPSSSLGLYSIIPPYSSFELLHTMALVRKEGEVKLQV